MSSKRVLFVLTGAAGAGKSSALNYLHASFDMPCVSKLSDRAPRRDQLLTRGPGETITIPSTAFDRLALQPDVIAYEYGASRYLFFVDEVRALLVEHGMVAMILCKDDATDLLARRLRHVARVVRVYVHNNQLLIRDRLVENGHTAEEICSRVQRSGDGTTAYNQNPSGFEFLDNTTDWNGYTRQLDLLATRYGATPSSTVPALSPTPRERASNAA